MPKNAIVYGNGESRKEWDITKNSMTQKLGVVIVSMKKVYNLTI